MPRRNLSPRLGGILITLGATSIALATAGYAIHQHRTEQNRALGEKGRLVMKYYDQNHNGVLDPEEINMIGRALYDRANSRE